jgi:hypothetical protein
MNYKYGVSCSETLQKKWTATAIDCYKLGCCCSKCNLYKIFFKNSVVNCKMKETVIDLVRQIGVPSFGGESGYES